MSSGMYCICSYKNFSITDVEKFERRLIKWCKEECMHGRSMLVFDRESLKVEGKTEILRNGAEIFYKVSLHNISLTYTRIAETTMCIMHRVWENKTRSVMYNMPQKWNGTELWLCD